jgi:hypothetical protein
MVSKDRMEETKDSIMEVIKMDLITIEDLITNSIEIIIMIKKKILIKIRVKIHGQSWVMSNHKAKINGVMILAIKVGIVTHLILK